jgi:hypothetical protein
VYLSDASPSTDWLSTLVGTATQAYRDKKIIQAQADRIRAGQQPVVLPQVSPNLTPLYDPMILQPATVPRSMVPALSTNTLLMVGAAAVLGVGAVLLLQGRRRR